MSRWGRATTVVVATVLGGVLVGCVPQPGREPQTPGTDELTAALEAIEHVVDVDYRPQEATINHGGFNNATVTVDAEADALCVLDLATATLWFGRPTSTLVTVVQDGRELTHEDLGLQFADARDLRRRYGDPPTPGATPEPSDVPACG